MSLAQAIPGATPTQYATLLLQGWNVPVNKTNIDTLTRWMSGESGGYNPGSSGGKYNPLNIVVQGNDKHTGQGGQQGNIADFGTMEDGVAATVRLFSHNPNASGILAGLKQSNQPATFAAINSFYQSWGGSFSPGAPPSETAVGTPGVAGGVGSGDTTTAGPGDGSGKTCGGDAVDSNDDSATIVRLVMPGSVPNLCVTRAQGRALLGAACLVAGGVLVIVGAGFVFGSTKPGKTVLGGVAPLAKVVGAV